MMNHEKERTGISHNHIEQNNNEHNSKEHNTNTQNNDLEIDLSVEPVHRAHEPVDGPPPLFLYHSQTPPPVENAHELLRVATLALEEDPDDVVALGARGQLNYWMSNFDEAIRDYSRLISLTPDDVTSYPLRAQTYMRLPDWESALADFEKARELEETRPEVIANLGEVLLQLGRINSAFHTLQQHLQTHPDSVILRLPLAEAARCLGDVDMATQILNDVLEIDPTAASAYVSLGKCEMESENESLAQMYFAQAAGLEPRLADAVNQAEQWARELNRLLAELQEDGRTLADAYIARSRLIFDSGGTFRQALADCHRAVRADPDDPNVRVQRAMLLREVGECDEALVDVNTALENASDFWFGWMVRAQIRSTMDDHAGAIEDYCKARDLSPTTAEIYVNLGAEYMYSCQVDMAIESLSKAISLDESLALAYQNRSQAYRYVGDITRAEADASAAERLQKESG